MLDLLHPEVVWVLTSTRPGEVLRGKFEAEAFFDEIAGKFYDLVTRPDRRVISENSFVIRLPQASFDDDVFVVERPVHLPERPPLALDARPVGG